MLDWFRVSLVSCSERPVCAAPLWTSSKSYNQLAMKFLHEVFESLDRIMMLLEKEIEMIKHPTYFIPYIYTSSKYFNHYSRLNRPWKIFFISIVCSRNTQNSMQIKFRSTVIYMHLIMKHTPGLYCWKYFSEPHVFATCTLVTSE